MSLPKTPADVPDLYIELTLESFLPRYEQAKTAREIPGHTRSVTREQFIRNFARRLGRNRAERDAIECACWSEVSGMNAEAKP